MHVQTSTLYLFLNFIVQQDIDIDTQTNCKQRVDCRDSDNNNDGFRYCIMIIIIIIVVIIIVTNNIIQQTQQQIIN